MPGGDRTGPWGMGPRTGRGMGYCAGNPYPGFMNPWPFMAGGFGYGRGFGLGRGFGRRPGWGMGRGFRRAGFFPFSYPSMMPYGYPPISPYPFPYGMGYDAGQHEQAPETGKKTK